MVVVWDKFINSFITCNLTGWKRFGGQSKVCLRQWRVFLKSPRNQSKFIGCHKFINFPSLIEPICKLSYVWCESLKKRSVEPRTQKKICSIIEGVDLLRFSSECKFLLSKCD